MSSVLTDKKAVRPILGVVNFISRRFIRWLGELAMAEYEGHDVQNATKGWPSKPSQRRSGTIQKNFGRRTRRNASVTGFDSRSIETERKFAMRTVSRLGKGNLSERKFPT
eukprot:6207568-Pleurochrysis_carterae.AAC.1